MDREEPNWAAIGKLVKSLRRQRRVTYRELATEAGLGRGTVLRIEAGFPSRRDTLRKLEKALNLSSGVLTHSKPLVSGPYYLQDMGHDFIHVRQNPKHAKSLPAYTQEMLQNPEERRRIGGLGFISCFQWESDLGLLGAKMRSTLMELHDETTPGQHDGEELVFGVRGTSVVRLGEEELIVHEHQSASFWPSQPHRYAPDPSSAPSLLLSVRIDSKPNKRPSR
jgi:transcriptional regulator with XRE-family HTH domain